ncbi:hypothetical protein [Hasllibacter sp. MH4015]|uniref:hypothetical protein n=1 Tax=Hasllibacter sp. MH4015 TaxID=2854029 RepID=UPI001CD2D94C|nr:hypothetical protein [Hasllibacter sp. MH4015]
MDADITPSIDFVAATSGPQIALIGALVILMRLIPILIGLGAILKLRRFPHLRALHWTLLTSAGLALSVGLVDLLARALVSDAARHSGTWFFIVLFAISWLAVTWIRSLLKTRMQPRWIDVAALAVLALAVALGIIFALTVSAPT